MDVLTSETCWALNNEIIKQVTSGWSIFIQTRHTWDLVQWNYRIVSAQCVRDRMKRAAVCLVQDGCLPAFVDMAWGRSRRTSNKIVNLQGEACKQDLAKTKQQLCTLDQGSWYDVCRKQTINRSLCDHLTQLRKYECSEIEYTNWRGQVRSPSSVCFYQNCSNYIMIFTL